MNYKKIHDRIIRIAKKREKKLAAFEKRTMEQHHVIPRSVSGNNKWQGDKVFLHPREHYIVHQFIVKFNSKNANLIFALHRMAHHPNAKNNGIIYHDWIKKRVSAQIAINNKKPKKKVAQ